MNKLIGELLLQIYPSFTLPPIDIVSISLSDNLPCNNYLELLNLKHSIENGSLKLTVKCHLRVKRIEVFDDILLVLIQLHALHVSASIFNGVHSVHDLSLNRRIVLLDFKSTNEIAVSRILIRKNLGQVSIVSGVLPQLDELFRCEGRHESRDRVLGVRDIVTLVLLLRKQQQEILHLQRLVIHDAFFQETFVENRKCTLETLVRNVTLDFMDLRSHVSNLLSSVLLGFRQHLSERLQRVVLVLLA